MYLRKEDCSQYLDTPEFFIVEKQSDWLTTSEAAAIMDITPQAVQRLCRKKGIECRKHGRDWMVNRVSAENYNPKKTGRPKNKQDG